jgi:hypothetical protein
LQGLRTKTPIFLPLLIALVSKVFLEVVGGAQKNNWPMVVKIKATKALGFDHAQFRGLNKTGNSIL